MSAVRNYDVIIHGATGFTGRLVARHFAKHYPPLSGIKWCIAGRNQSSLEKLKSFYEFDNSVDIHTCDINNSASLDSLIGQGKILIACAGPFINIGLPVLESCVRTGTHYVDITGESEFCKKAIDLFHAKAEEKQLKLVNCCGFDCVPADVGCEMVLSELIDNLDANPIECTYKIVGFSGGLSGGTISTAFEMMSDKSGQLAKSKNPYYLCGETECSEATIAANRDFNLCDYDSDEKAWMAPWVMQSIDTRIVHRSNFLQGWKYGHDFVWKERERKSSMIWALLAVLGGFVVQQIAKFKFILDIVRPLLVTQGDGPSEDLLQRGFFTIKYSAKGVRRANGEEVKVTGWLRATNGEGYKHTATMVAECAMCILQNSNELPPTFGVLTPSVAFGSVLRERLASKDVVFRVEKQT